MTPAAEPTPLDVGEEHLRAGRLVAAARQADALLARVAEADPADDAPDPDDVHRAAVVLESVLAHRGMLERGAELHRWADARTHRACPAAAVALVGSGEPDPPMDPDDDAAAPTLQSGAESLVARGVTAAVRAGGSDAALTDLARAAATLECRDAPPAGVDSPAALGALVALARGETGLARGLLDRAIERDLGGPAFRRRHRLLRTWSDLADGDLPAVREALDGAADPERPEARDQLLAVALEAGLARRAGDTRGGQEARGRARDVLLRHTVDLWSLLPLGELVAGGAGREPWSVGPLADAEALLERLGHPPLWTAPWRWHAFVAAAVVEDRATASARARALEGCARAAGAVAAGDSAARSLADAAQRWLAVLDGDVDPEAVTAAAVALRDAGLACDGARLAKDAAVRVGDRRTLTALLGVARAVLPTAARTVRGDPDAVDGAEEPSATAGADAAIRARRVLERPGEPAGPLSARESEVASLLLEGMTYRQVAERLFISAKTVEHHVGRIRQRLGSGSRTELFADLRDALAPPTARPSTVP